MQNDAPGHAPPGKNAALRYAAIAALVAAAILLAFMPRKVKGPEAGPVVQAPTTDADRDGAVISEDVIYFEDTVGHFARPKEPGLYPGVIMIHEWWGLNDHIKAQARTLAEEGYLVLAVDLFGEVAATPDEAMKQVAALDQDRAIANLKAAAAYLRGRNAPKIASLGWCFGGGQSLQLALSGEPLDATVMYYGGVVTDAERLDAIMWPVLGIFGEDDRSIPASDVKKFDAALDDAHVVNEVHLYPGVGHAFANPSNPGHAPEEAEDAWAKTLDFLAKYLQ
jgi:carboxymethylenebutenolidase